jgi:hypothetical protein
MGWQDAGAIAVVLGAAFYLSSLAWKGLIGGRGGSGGCGTSCGKCSPGGAEPSSRGVEGGPASLVSIGPPPARHAAIQPERAEAP